MSNFFKVRKGLSVDGSTELSGSIIVTGNPVFSNVITGSIQSAETASYVGLAESASYALTSSLAIEAVSSSYALSSSEAQHAVTSSYSLTASYALNAGSGGGSSDNSYVKGTYFASQDTIAGSLLGFTEVVAIDSGSVRFLRFADRGLNSSEILPAAGMVKNDIPQGTNVQLELVSNGIVDIFLPADFSGSAGDDLWLQGFNGTRFAYFTAVQPTGSYIQKIGKIINTSGSLARIYVDIVQEWDDEQIAFNAVSSSYALSSSFSESGSYSVTSSHAVTASYALSASIAESSSYALTASHLIDFTPAAPVKISGSAPQDLESGSLWYNTEDGNTYVQFNSPTGSGWVPAMASILSVESASYATSSSYAETASYALNAVGSQPTIYFTTATSAAASDVVVNVGETAMVWFVNRGSTAAGLPQYSHAPVYFIRVASDFTLYSIIGATANSSRTAASTNTTGNLIIQLRAPAMNAILNLDTGKIFFDSTYVAGGDRLMVQIFKNG